MEDRVSLPSMMFIIERLQDVVTSNREVLACYLVMPKSKAAGEVEGSICNLKTSYFVEVSMLVRRRKGRWMSEFLWE